MLRLFEILTELGVVLAVILLFVALSAEFAPAQSAAIALAIAVVAIPYCMAGMLHRREVLRRMPPPPPPPRASFFGKKNKPLNLEPLDF